MLNPKICSQAFGMFLVVVSLFFSGCSTYVTRLNPITRSYHHGVYPATKAEYDDLTVGIFETTSDPVLFPVLETLLVLDFPFSVVSDTLLLPVDLAGDERTTAGRGTSGDEH